MNKADFFRNARNDLAGPLAGVTVVEATTTWAGPMAACLLADYGARVIKVELPEGEVARRLPPFVPDSGLSIANETVNRNKESLTLDLRKPEGKEVLLQLVSTADIFVENFRPGTLGSWGLSYSDLCETKADIIYVSVSGFGQFGPLSDRVGYDPIAQNYSGWSSLNGEPSGGPTKAPTFLGDDLAGLHGALGAMAALRHRDQTGEGQHVDIALCDSLIYQSDGMATMGALDIDVPRMGNQFTIAAPVNIYPCTDGSVFAGVLLDSHWQVLATEMAHDELAELSGIERIERREELDPLLAAYCASRTVDNVVTKFADLGLPAVRVNTPADVAKEPHVHDRDMLITTELSDGNSIPLVGPAAKLSRTPISIRNAAPTLGQDNQKIFGELGLSDGDVERLRNSGVIQ